MGELKHLGRYEIVRVLSSGAMGVVYDENRLHRRVAIKTIIKRAMADAAHAADYSKRFMREAQSIARSPASAAGDEKTIIGATPDKAIAASAGEWEKTAVTGKGAPETKEEAGSDIEKYLSEREELGTAFEEESKRFLTVMFTGLKGSTTITENTIAEKERDIVSRMLIKEQAGILMPAITESNGVYLKAIGDGSLSYFADAQDAVRAAARIQKAMDALNMSKKFKFPVLMRIGMHSGKCVVEDNDIYGDVVDTASRFESSADAGGILMSEDTYNALPDRAEVHCRFVKQITLKGKQEPCNAYKAFWNPQEIELDKQGSDVLPRQEYAVPLRSSGMKLVWGVLGLIGIVLLLTLGSKYFGAAQTGETRHSISDSASPSGAPEAQR